MIGDIELKIVMRLFTLLVGILIIVLLLLVSLILKIIRGNFWDLFLLGLVGWLLWEVEVVIGLVFFGEE